MTLIIAIIFTSSLTIFNLWALKSLSAGLVFACMYLAPVVINSLLVHLQKKKSEGKKLSIVLPFISIVGYAGFSFFATSTGAWKEFALRHTVNSENFRLEIGTDLFSVSDMVFIGLVFFALAGLNYIIYSISKKGVTIHA